MRVCTAMEYSRNMWLRSALTSLLAAIVLCVSCAASICAMNCEISGLRAIVHTGHEHPAVAMDEFVPDHCGHVAVSQSKSAGVLAGHDVHIGQYCDSRVCTQDQVEAVSNAGYHLDQPAAVMTSTVAVPAVHVVVRLPNYGVADLLPNPPPRYLDVLRL
jgi:hypothetical protein